MAGKSSNSICQTSAELAGYETSSNTKLTVIAANVPAPMKIGDLFISLSSEIVFPR
jgi:hypothetical protein